MQTTDQSYKVNESYKGQRNILVPTRMYSRNALLGAMHIKSDKYLGVNLDRYALTFHSDKEASNKNPDHEIAFSHIKSLEADVTKADSGKYYLKVHTDEGDLKFKFNNARDFHGVVEALRNTIHNDKPFYNATESYNTESKKYTDKPAAYNKYDKDEISSDDQQDYKSMDKNRNASNLNKDIAKASYDTKKDIADTNYKAFDDIKSKEDDLMKNKKDIYTDLNKDLKNDNLDAQKDNYRMNRDLINDNRYDAGLDKDLNKDSYKYNKDAIKDTYSAQKDDINRDYKVNKDIDKDLAKDQYRANKDSIKDQRDVNLAYNKDQYKANKDTIKETEHWDKDRTGLAHDINDTAYDAAKSNIKRDADLNKDSIKADYNQYKEGNKIEKDLAKDNMKSDVHQAKDELRTDLRGAKDTKDGRY